MSFGSRAFIPSGLISPSGEPVSPPEPHALLSGHVLESALQENTISGKPFCWALVDTLGGTYDVVIDPALSGNAARIARWDFTADQIAPLFAGTPRGEGIHLNLRWPASPPEHERLVVFVRYTTAEGDQFEASQSVLIDLARDSQVDVEAID